MKEFYDLQSSVNQSVYKLMKSYFGDMMPKWDKECREYNNMTDEEVGECGKNLTQFQVAVFGAEETIENYLANSLWCDFGDIPMNPETECIECEWCGFAVGTHREEIWCWFEEKFNISIADLMYN